MRSKSSFFTSWPFTRATTSGSVAGTGFGGVGAAGAPGAAGAAGGVPEPWPVAAGGVAPDAAFCASGALLHALTETHTTTTPNRTFTLTNTSLALSTEG